MPGFGGRRPIQRKLKERLKRLFPERQIFLRQGGAVRFVRLSRRRQGVLAVLLLVIGGWIAYSSTVYVFYERILERKNQSIQEAQEVRVDLLQQTRSQEQYIAALTRALGENQANLVTLNELNAALKERLRVVDSGLEDVTARHDVLVEERHGLQSRVEELEQLIVDFQDSQEELLIRLTARTDSDVQEAEKVIAMTGLDAGELLAEMVDGRAGKGGPFIPAAAMEVGAQLEVQRATLEDQLDRWEALRYVLRVLPLTAPLESYDLNSRFGKRRDPLTKEWALHRGVDLTADRKTPVLSPAPGIVVFVGWKGRYGKMVEIDHGLGVRTRYGHLDKILVKYGQEVGFWHKIGLLGNTGRSTGSHLHYEVLFHGVSHDPLQFIRAGKHVFKS